MLPVPVGAVLCRRNIDSLADAVGIPGDRSIAQRLDAIERVLFALARVQDIDPDTAP
ncbi:hypothetical protein ACFV27_46160 [Streptomyces antimycoticus]|uniref:hypothetical protein n=1 Tax=Streptomyces antimycoticus TaxID=68175 RepID=UPI001374BE8F|nr:hypothetical protein [Streptomyces antimycoticus]WJD94581.1 hypothetical protein QR300_00090 [Streptomyces antimycoticus]